MRTLHVPLPGSAYHIDFADAFAGEEGASSLQPHVQDKYCLLISDSNVAPLYAERAEALLKAAGAAQVGTSIFTAGEASKTLQTLQGIYSEAVRQRLDRSSVAVALGGGVVGDTAGFFAATYMRGIDYVQIATSLVAQVDSSVGGKTAVDLPEGKNLVGAFYQPRHVLIDVHTLQTLEPLQLHCGLAEVVKYGIIMAPDFFDYLEQHVDQLLATDEDTYRDVVHRCCALKAEVVLEDEKEISGRRAILNYGHTFGHAIEQLTHFTGYTHGAAIAIGMGMAVDLALQLAPSDQLRELRRRQDAIFQALSLPIRANDLEPADILDAMRADKKYQKGKNRLILPQRLGHVELVRDTPDEQILQAIEGRCES